MDDVDRSDVLDSIEALGSASDDLYKRQTEYNAAYWLEHGAELLERQRVEIEQLQSDKACLEAQIQNIAAWAEGAKLAIEDLGAKYNGPPELPETTKGGEPCQECGEPMPHELSECKLPEKGGE